MYKVEKTKEGRILVGNYPTLDQDQAYWESKLGTVIGEGEFEVKELTKPLEYGVKIRAQDRFESEHIWTPEIEKVNDGRFVIDVIETDAYAIPPKEAEGDLWEQIRLVISNQIMIHNNPTATENIIKYLKSTLKTKH